MKFNVINSITLFYHQVTLNMINICVQSVMKYVVYVFLYLYKMCLYVYVCVYIHKLLFTYMFIHLSKSEFGVQSVEKCALKHRGCCGTRPRVCRGGGG